MKKLKLYLDTSVISHLDAPDTPEKMEDTKKLWEEIKNNRFEVVLSDLTLRELHRCAEPKHTKMFEYLSIINFDEVAADDKVIEIAEKFIDFGILKQKSLDDCKHIATAITNNCDAIVSWNFKHIVAHKTMLGVKSITALYGKPDLLIYTPQSLINFNKED